MLSSDAHLAPSVTVERSGTSSEGPLDLLSLNDVPDQGDGKNTRGLRRMAEENGDVEARERMKHHLKGWRLHALTFGLCLSLLLSAVESTVVSTALTSITNDLGGFDEGSWIVNAYMLTYSGFLLVFAKFSDVFGRKWAMLGALLLFTIFSSLCGVARSLLELKFFRAIQGIGGSGIYSMVMVIAGEMVPVSEYGTYMGILGSIFVLANILGPILGGVISQQSSWRWVFLMNAPTGTAALAFVYLVLPAHFPYQRPSSEKIPVWRSIRRVDFVGAVLSLAASILLVFALQQGGLLYQWASPTIVRTLVFSGVSFFLFLFWERCVKKRQWAPLEAVFPWPLIHNRLFMGMLLNSFFSGFPFLVVIISLPQRFQVVDGATSSTAGFRLIPLLISLPMAGILSGVLVSRIRMAPLYVLVIGGTLQVVGLSLLSTQSRHGPALIYAMEAVIGFGFGLNSSTLIILIPLVVEERDKAVGMATITQIHLIGSSIGVALATNIFNTKLKSELKSILSSRELAAVLQSSDAIRDLASEPRERVEYVYTDAYNWQLKATVGFSALALVLLVVLIERRPRRL